PLLPQIAYPIGHDGADITADRKERGDERLRELRLHVPRVLIDLAFNYVDMPELERGNRAVACAGKDRERKQRAVPSFDISGGGHAVDNMANLLQGRNAGRAGRLGYPRVFGREVEVVGVLIGDSGLVARLSGEPDKKSLQGCQGGVQGRLAQ